MKILFALSSPEYLRYYDDTIVELAARGHDVMVAANIVREGKFVRFDTFGAGNEHITVAGLVPARDDRWTRLASGVRGTMDFVRYLHPELSSARVLRARLKRQGLPRALQWADRIQSLAPASVRRIMNGLAALERAIPTGEALSQFLEAHAPDVVVVSPLIEAASEQVDLVKAARVRGIPVAACIASWDNLTNKGDLRIPTDAVVVWNEAQKREATNLHRVPAERVAVTGAQLFDRWFDRSPAQSRDAFCRMVGLPAEKPFVLFVGSSVFIARAEAEVPFVRRWIEAIRRSQNPAVRGLSVLLRPHPYSGPAWAEADWSDLGNVAVWPRVRYNPVDEGNRADFFDSMYHSEAVAGINTSAMIEAAIVGRPVFSVRADEFAGTQEGTLHFRHMLPENGGFLRVASTLDEHIAQLGAVLANPIAARDELKRFVGSFVRPHGMNRPCTPILASTIEQCAASKPAPAADTATTYALRAFVTPLAMLANVMPEEGSRKGTAWRRFRERWRKSKRRAAKTSGAPLTVPTTLVMLAPFAVAAVLVAVFAASELWGGTPFSYEPPRNIAEAAGMGMPSEVLRFKALGQDPRDVHTLRPDIISSEVTRTTAAEAAIWSRRFQLVQLLERQGAFADAVTRTHLACLAGDIRALEIQKYLTRAGAEACVPGATVRRIAARRK